jgi:hypothetical protein
MLEKGRRENCRPSFKTYTVAKAIIHILGHSLERPMPPTMKRPPPNARCEAPLTDVVRDLEEVGLDYTQFE